ncbi:MAG: 2-dehydropantoate 2-reductase [Anaerolineales bacterium]
MKYLVFGTGAVGGYLGGRLALAGHPVTFLARPHVAEAMVRQGLRLTGDQPEGILRQPNAVSSLEQAFAQGTPDVILLAVKAFDCEEAAKALAAASPQPHPLVCLLNGIGNEQTLARELGHDQVIPASLTTAVRMVAPAVIQVDRKRGLGLDASDPLSAQLAVEMEEAGIEPRLYPDAERMKWSKLLTNIVTNATAAIVGWTPSQIFTHPGLYRLETEALREAVRVMRHMGLRPQGLPGVPVGLLANLIFLPPTITQRLLRRTVAGGRGDKPPSFTHDIGRGRSEVLWLNGAVANHGERLSLQTPANALLTRVLMDLVDDRVPHAQFLDQPGKLLSLAHQAGVPGVQGYNHRDGA